MDWVPILLEKLCKLGRGTYGDITTVLGLPSMKHLGWVDSSDDARFLFRDRFSGPQVLLSGSALWFSVSVCAREFVWVPTNKFIPSIEKAAQRLVPWFRSALDPSHPLPVGFDPVYGVFIDCV